MKLFGLILAAFLLSGCATTAVDKTATTLDLSKESVAVLSLKFTNAYKPGFGSQNLGVFVEPATGGTSAMHSAPVEGADGEALVVTRLAPGNYKLTKLFGRVQRAIFFGSIDFDAETEFKVPPQSVVYLGSIDMVNREKTGNTAQATGGALPLVDQAVTGMSGGTLDLTLADRFDRDTARLKNEYASMRNVTVVRAPLRQLSVKAAMGSGAAPQIVQASP